VTIFPARMTGGAPGFKYSIGPRSSKGLGPRYSEATYASKAEAHAALWLALAALIERTG
jgi:hypothetical protein